MIREDTEYLSFGDGAAPSSRPVDSVTCHGSIGGGHGSEAAAAAAGAAEDTGPLSMYEDTGLLSGSIVDGGAGGQQSAGTAADHAAGAAAGAAAGRASGGGGFGGDDTGLLIREDTCCLSDAPVAGRDP